MSITIPPVPEGIHDPENLYNDGHQELDKLKWSNPDLHARLKWIGEQVPFAITQWYSLTGGFDESFRAPTMFRAEVAPGVGIDIDLRNVMGYADMVASNLAKVKAPDAPVQVFPPYPGISVVAPAGDNPIGELWKPAPVPNREVYREVEGVTGYKHGDYFETDKARYVRIIVSFPGQGAFGRGGKQTPGWQVEYRR